MTATTTLPARLDSIQWILVGGFAALFALGFVYLWRRPQSVSASGVTHDLSGGRSYSSRASKSEGALAPEVRDAVAEANASVRGGLDEMKDSLFRLELRHQAGTINEQDYARERQRIETILRDLVRG